MAHTSYLSRFVINATSTKLLMIREYAVMAAAKSRTVEPSALQTPTLPDTEVLIEAANRGDQKSLRVLVPSVWSLRLETD